MSIYARSNSRIAFLLTFIFVAAFVQSKPAIKGELVGYLGNQLFQIAAVSALAFEHGAVATFPSLKTSDKWGLPLNYRMVFPHLKTFSIKGRQFCYHEPYFLYKKIPYFPNMRIRGYFQSEKYFYKYKKEILEMFAPSSEILAYLNEKYHDIIAHPATVSVHIRSYLKESVPDFQPTHGIEYVKRAMAFFPEDSLFVVFSNEIEQCKQDFATLDKKICFVHEACHVYDFYLMSLCKHNIICNSTFSWWAAYLNRNPGKKVIAPMPWFSQAANIDVKDLIPSEWKIIHMGLHAEGEVND